MLGHIGDFLEICSSYSEVVNLKCAIASMKLRKEIGPEPTNGSSDSTVDAVVAVADRANIDQAVEIVILAEEAIKKAKENLTKSKPPSNTILKSKNKGPICNDKSKRPTKNVEKCSSAKNISKSSLSKDSEVTRVKKELEMLIKKAEPQDITDVKLQKPDPCSVACSAKSLAEHKQRQLHLDQMSRIFEDCWMLQKHASSERESGCKSKEQFCSKLLASPIEDPERISPTLGDILRLSSFISWLRDYAFPHVISSGGLQFLPVDEAIWMLCTVRKLLHLHNQLSTSSVFTQPSNVQSFEFATTQISPSNSPLWIPRSLSQNPIDQLLLRKYGDLTSANRVLLSYAQCLLAKRALISLWCRYLACDDMQQWSANSIRGAHNLLCASRLAPSFVILESDSK